MTFHIQTVLATNSVFNLLKRSKKSEKRRVLAGFKESEKEREKGDVFGYTFGAMQKYAIIESYFTAGFGFLAFKDLISASNKAMLDSSRRP